MLYGRFQRHTKPHKHSKPSPNAANTSRGKAFAKPAPWCATPPANGPANLPRAAPPPPENSAPRLPAPTAPGCPMPQGQQLTAHRANGQAGPSQHTPPQPTVPHRQGVIGLHLPLSRQPRPTRCHRLSAFGHTQSQQAQNQTRPWQHQTAEPSAKTGHQCGQSCMQ